MEANTPTPDAQENQPKKEKAGRKGLLYVVIGIIAVIVLSVILIGVLGPKPEVVDLSLSSSEIEYGQGLTINVTCENKGIYPAKKAIPIYVNEGVAFENELKLKGKEVLTETFDLDGLTEGSYTVSVGDLSRSFTVLSEASLSVDFSNAPEFFIADVPSEIGFSITNSGGSTGNTSLDILVNDTVLDTREYSVGGHKTVADSFVFDGTADESMNIKIGDAEFEAKVYESSKLKNANKLMNNTVKGYGYFMFNNNSDQDIVVYLTEHKNESTAVAAISILAGQAVKISSFPHGSYSMFIQTGEYWVDELGAFAKDQIIAKSKTEFEFENNVSKAYGGTYTYWTINFWGDLANSDYYVLVANPPALVK